MRTIGEGSFAKVKSAVNTETGQSAAIKIIDKQMVMDNKLMEQVVFHFSFSSISLSHSIGFGALSGFFHGVKHAADATGK